MKIRIITFVICLILQSVAVSAVPSVPDGKAQIPSLPSLPKDRAITGGTLPNGVKYYFCSNPSSIGSVAFAVIQKMDPKLGRDELVPLAKERFSRVRIGEKSLTPFLTRNNMLPGRNGYIRIRPGSIMYSFDSYSSASGESVLDSTLFAVCSLCQDASSQGQPSSSQAIVVAGDFKQDQMLAKLKLMSILNVPVRGNVPEPEYEWDENRRMKDVFTAGHGPVSHINVSFKGARTPPEYMNTVLPVISDKMASEFSILLKGRLYPAFRAAGHHVWINCSHINSTDSISDEEILLTVSCMRKFQPEVMEVLKTELSRLRTWGVNEIEYTYARDAHKQEWLSASRDISPTNESFIRRCASEFLYGASLSHSSQQIKFAYRDLPDSVQTVLFNNYMLKMLDAVSDADSTLEMTPSLARREVIAASMNAYIDNNVVKMPKKDKEEYLTGGMIWNIPGGINVIYKKMNTSGEVTFCYAVRGGRRWADPDFFTCIDGVHEESFSNYLAASGIEMKLVLNPADVRLVGKVDSEHIEQLFAVLCALSGQDENKKVFSPDTYKLLVLAGDIPYEEMKCKIARYASSFGPSTAWMPKDPSSENLELQTEKDGHSLDRRLTLEVSAYNKALSDVAFFALKNALAGHLSGNAISFELKGGFAGFPSDDYIFSCFPKRVAPDGFDTNTLEVSEEKMWELVQETYLGMKDFCADEKQMKVFRTMAQNAFDSYRKKPEFYVDMAVERYLDQKDLFRNYSVWVKSVSSESIRFLFNSVNQ